MAEKRAPLPVKLFCGLIRNDEIDAAEVESVLRTHFGDVEMRFGPHRFDTYTRFYCREMGEPLWRHFFAFEGVVDADILVRAKSVTNELERRWLRGARRCVNLDPGYIHPARLVLASCKDFAHRIYLGGGIYAEVTLLWRRGTWQALEWTFPDFASGAYFDFFTQLRQRYLQSLKSRRRCG